MNVRGRERSRSLLHHVSDADQERAARIVKEVPPEERTPVQVAITCRHGNIKPDLNDYITRKSEKLLTYFERVTAIQVTVDFDAERVRTEILVDAEHKHNFVAHAEGDEAGPTFDQALQKMEQQIRKYKEKLQDHRRDRPLKELETPSQTESAAE